MTFNQFLAKPSSKKITLVEIDTPLIESWQNFEPGIWFIWLTPGKATELDDDNNLIHWGSDNETYYNIGSLNVDGEIYTEVSDLATVRTTNKSWFYDTDTTYIYLHIDGFDPPESVSIKAPGAILGFTNQIDNILNNYFEDVYYEPLLTGIPNLSKKKDSLFFGILQYQGGTLTFNNASGHFDDFAQRDLYAQPIRIRLSFEGLPFADSKLVYSGRVEDFSHDLTNFKLVIADIRKLFTRKLPINILSVDNFPSLDSKLEGTPIPITFGPIIKGPAYKTSSGNWIFADTEFNPIDSGIVVTKEDDSVFSHGGTETDGTFTGADTDDKLYVTFTQSSVQNGLDTIADALENYEGVTFNSSNYDLSEWNQEKNNVSNIGIWIGKGNLLTVIDIIEQICTDNQGIFDVLADSRFTFRTFQADRIPTHEIFEDELINDPSVVYDSEEYLSSVKVEYSEDLKEKEPLLFTNSDFESEVFARYRQHKERTFETRLTNEADATILTDRVMEQSRFIFPINSLVTKTQNIGLRILDNALYTFKRQNGKEITPRSRYQTLGIDIDLSNYEMKIILKQIEEDDKIYSIIDGGEPGDSLDFYDGGSPSTVSDNIIDGGTI